jgi:hypothetical protein
MIEIGGSTIAASIYGVVMNETQLEKDFIKWLAPQCVEMRYSRWFTTESGECDEGDYCADCVEAELTERKSAGSQFVVVEGWDEAVTSDRERSCDRCGCLLETSPTREFIKEDISQLAEMVAEMVDGEQLDPDLATSIHNWLTGMGDRHESDWEKVAPHAARLMANDNQQVVPAGFITYTPADARDWYDHDSVWLGIYQWFAERLIAGEYPLEYLVDTSGINRSSLREIADMKEPSKVIKGLLSFVGSTCGRGKFLASLGLERQADLDTPIRMEDRRCDWPTFGVRGRKLIESPNKHHPEAKVLTKAELLFSTDGRWEYQAYYDYAHYDRSYWCVSFCQDDGESLANFTSRVNADLEAMLEPCDQTEYSRLADLRNWDQIREAISKVFYYANPPATQSEWEVELTDLLMDVDGLVLTGRRIHIDRKKMATLKRWIKDQK